jgi:hypothetical protein
MRAKAHIIGITTGKHRRWTDAEIELLKKLYPALGPKRLAPRFGRSATNVRTKASNLGIKTLGQRYWSDAEVRLLQESYMTTPVRELAKKLGRSYEAVMVKAGQLGIRKRQPPNRYLPE